MPSCVKCSSNITQKKKKGVKCTRCPLWIHNDCAGFPLGHEVWTCPGCNRRSSTVRRVSSVVNPPARKSSIGSSLQTPLNVSNDSNVNIQLANEISELKTLMREMLRRMTAMEEDHKVELRFLRNTNTDLLNEISIMKKSLSTLPDFLFTSGAGLSHDLVRSSDKQGSPRSLRSRTQARNEISRSSRNFETPNIHTETDRSMPVENVPEPSTSSSYPTSKRTHEWISVSNIEIGTSAEDIKLFLAKKTKASVDSFSCAKITPRTLLNPSYFSYKLAIPSDLVAEVNSPLFWPEGVVIREFVEKRSFFHQTASIKIVN